MARSGPQVQQNRISYFRKLAQLVPAAQRVAYWPFDEVAAATVARDFSGRGNVGAYNNVTLAAAGIPGNRRKAASFNGTSSYVDLYSAGLNTAFSGAAGSICGWAQMSGAGVWTDGIDRTFIRIRVDANNFCLFHKTTTNNQLQFSQTAGAVAKTVNNTSLGGSVAFWHWALTWDKAADALKAYLNGAQVGSTQTGLGTWAGALSSTTCLAGAATTSTLFCSGIQQHLLIANVALPLATIAALAVA